MISGLAEKSQIWSLAAFKLLFNDFSLSLCGRARTQHRKSLGLGFFYPISKRKQNALVREGK